MFVCCLSAHTSFAQQSDEQLAAYYFSNGQFDQAAELYETLYRNNSNTYYYQMLFRSYLELNQFREAERLAEKRLKKTPNDLTLYVDLGTVYSRSGNQKKAGKQYDKALESIGVDSRQVSNLAMAFDAIGMSDYVVNTYLTARQKAKNRFLYVSEVATAYARVGKWEAMIQEYFDLLDNSPASMNSVQVSLQRNLREASDDQLADGLRRSLIMRVQQSPNNKVYLEMMIWFSLQQKDFQFAYTQAKAVAARFPDMGAEQLYRVANIATSNEDFVVAQKCYESLVAFGNESPYYFDSRTGLLQAKFAQLNRNYPVAKGSLQTLISEYEAVFEELGRNEKTVPILRDYASLMAYHANRPQKAVDALYDILEMPRVNGKTKSEVKLDLGDLMLFAGEVWDASLLYMQVEKAFKNDVIGAQAKLKNAQLSYYHGDFLWAKSQLDVLRASTSKLVANDAMRLSLLISDNMEDDSTFEMLSLYAAADLLLYQNKLDSAWDAYSAISQRVLSHPLLDEVMFQKSQIRMRQERFVEADSLLQQLVDFYPEDILADDALMLLAQLNEEKLNNKERARSCYEKLLLDYPVSLFVDQARQRYNAIKQ